MSYRCRNSSETNNRFINTNNIGIQCMLSSSDHPVASTNSRHHLSVEEDGIQDLSSSYCPEDFGKDIRLDNGVYEDHLVNDKISSYNNVNTSKFESRYFYNSFWLRKNSINDCFSDSGSFSHQKLKSSRTSFMEKEYNRGFPITLKSMKSKILNYPAVVPKFISPHKLKNTSKIHNFPVYNSQNKYFGKGKYNGDLPINLSSSKSFKDKNFNYPVIAPKFIPNYRSYSYGTPLNSKFISSHKFQNTSKILNCQVYKSQNKSFGKERYNGGLPLNLSTLKSFKHKLYNSDIAPKFISDYKSRLYGTHLNNNIVINHSEYNRYFLSNMPVDINSKDIKLYLENKLQTNVVCYKINMNNSGSSCFYISVPAYKHDKIISSNLWPCGASISFFYGSLASSLRF